MVSQFRGTQNHALMYTQALIRVLGFFVLVIFMPLIIPTLPGLILTRPKLALMMMSMIHIFPCLLVPHPGTLIQVLVIMSAGMRQRYVTLHYTQVCLFS